MRANAPRLFPDHQNSAIALKRPTHASEWKAAAATLNRDDDDGANIVNASTDSSPVVARSFYTTRVSLLRFESPLYIPEPFSFARSGLREAALYCQEAARFQRFRERGYCASESRLSKQRTQRNVAFLRAGYVRDPYSNWWRRAKTTTSPTFLIWMDAEPGK